MNKYIAFYLIAINLLSFLLYGIDKRRAKRKKWRIKEALLLTLGIIGGGAGGIFRNEIFQAQNEKILFLSGKYFGDYHTAKVSLNKFGQKI